MPARRQLFTFGYEGLDIDAFIARLRADAVETVMDVRQLPLSRKKGFSKSALGAALQHAGIAYLHVSALGCPRPIRDRYKRDGDWAAYTESFLGYLETQEAPLRDLAALAGDSTVCLMCFEADFTRCHRSFVARAAARLGASEVWHLARNAKAAVPDQGPGEMDRAGS